MGAYEIDLFNHRLSVDPHFRQKIQEGDSSVWNSIDLTRDEREALETADIAWLYAHGANDFLLHNILRFKIGGATLDSYSKGIKRHLRDPEVPDKPDTDSASRD